MLKVNVGLSRKVSENFHSRGFSVNLEGEVIAPLDDPELCLGKIRELYDLAEESLNQQVDRYEGESAIASRDEEPRSNGRSSFDRRIEQHQTHGAGTRQENGDGRNGQRDQETQPPATNKQIQFLLTIGKRQGMSKQQLETRVAGIVGRSTDLYALSKREAGLVLDQLANGSGQSNRR